MAIKSRQIEENKKELLLLLLFKHLGKMMKLKKKRQ